MRFANLAPRGRLGADASDRAWDISSLDDAYEQFLEAASPGYSRHYRDFPFLDELTVAGGFAEMTSYSVEWFRQMTDEQFLGISLSSTKVRRAIENLGKEKVVNGLKNLMMPFLTADRRVHVHCRSRLFLATSY